MNKLRKYVMALSLAVVLASCSSPDGNFAGSEYMPDMAHSVAKEANVLNDYYYNTWDKRSTIDLYELTKLNDPVVGTIPRGYVGHHKSDDAHSAGISIPMNGHVPYHFANSNEGRDAAIAELLDNPFPITEAGLAKGKELYDVFCGLCHGETGNGLGYIYDEELNPNAKYPLAPANFLTSQFYEASNGRYYHAVYYGYNAMGSYKDKINYEERWQVIHYIRSLQAKELGVEYSETANTYNAAFGVPASLVEPMVMSATESSEENMMADGGHSSDDPNGNSHTTTHK